MGAVCPEGGPIHRPHGPLRTRPAARTESVTHVTLSTALAGEDSSLGISHNSLRKNSQRPIHLRVRKFANLGPAAGSGCAQPRREGSPKRRSIVMEAVALRRNGRSPEKCFGFVAADASSRRWRALTPGRRHPTKGCIVTHVIGGGGNRTRVRKPSTLRFYVCSPCFYLEPKATADSILRLVPGKSRWPAPRHPSQPARILTVLPQPTGRDQEDRALRLFKQPVRAQRCRWLLCFLPAV